MTEFKIWPNNKSINIEYKHRLLQVEPIRPM